VTTPIFKGAKGGGAGSFKQTPDNLRSDDTFEGVLGVCIGPVKGPKRGLKSIKVNGTAVENETGEPNLGEFTCIVGNGDPTLFPQTLTLKLGAGAAPTSVGLQLRNDPSAGGNPWITKTLANTNADHIDLRFVVQQLFKQTDKGVYDHTATIEIQMKPVGSTNWIDPTAGNPTTTYQLTGNPIGNGKTILLMRDMFDADSGAWPATDQPNQGGQLNTAGFAIKGKTTGPSVYELRIEVPNEGPYANTAWDVRCRLMEAESVDSGDGKDVQKRTIQWESLAGVYGTTLGTHEDWRGVAWLQVYGKASEALTGVPEMTGEWETKIVSVPPSGIFDPASRTYAAGTWDGSWAKAYTNDPAWIINDAISDSLSGLSLIAQGCYLNKWDALEASKWFSQQVPDGAGGTEPRYSLNIAMSDPVKAEDFIRNLAGAVGGLAWDQGDGEWRMKVDKPEAATDIFTLDNIVGEFSYTHTDVDTRYNDITMAFRNKEMDYREDRVRLFKNEHITKFGRKPTTMVAVGCTGRQEAMRRTKLRLETTTGEAVAVQFTTNRRGRNLDMLSTILVADGDLGDRENRSTGRAVAITSNSITLRDAVRLEVGVNYTLNFASPNPNYNPDGASVIESRRMPTFAQTRVITNSSAQRGNVTVLYIDQPLPADVDPNLSISLSATGLPTLPKLYRVLTVTPGEGEGEEFISISALEVNTAKWDLADNVTNEDTVFQDLRGSVPEPLMPPGGQFLSLVSVESAGGTDILSLVANWGRPDFAFISGFRVSYSVNGGSMQTPVERFQSNTFEIPNVGPGVYVVEVRTIDRRGGVSLPLTGTYEIGTEGMPTRNVPRGDWAPETDYKRGDFFAYEGSSYVVIRSHHSDATAPPPNANVTLMVEKGLDGESGLVGLLTNESHTVAADVSGVVPTGNWTGAGGTFKLYHGLDDVTADATFSVGPATGGATGGIGSNGVYYANGLTSTQGKITFYATYNGQTIAKDFSISKSLQGTTGASAKTVVITSDKQVFTFNSLDALTPAAQVITFTMNRQNPTAGQNPSWAATAFNVSGTSLGAVQIQATAAAGGATATTQTTVYLHSEDLPAGTNSVLVVGSSEGLSDSITVVKLKEGAVGAAAKVMYLSSSHQTFVYDSSTPQTQTTTFTALRQGTASTTVWRLFKADGTTEVALSSTYLTTSGDTASMTQTQFDAFLTAAATTAVVVVAQFTDTATVYSDRISVVKLVNGLDALAGYLTNENHTIPTDNLGNTLVALPAGAEGEFRVFLGTTDVSALATYSVVGTISMTVDLNTAVNTPVTGKARGYYRLATITADVATATLRATYAGKTIDKVLTISKSKTGLAGLTAILTNETHTLPTDNAGNNVDYTGASGYMRVYLGTVDVTSSCTFTTGGSATPGTDYSPAGLIASFPGSGAYQITGGVTTDAGWWDIKATYTPTGATITKRMTFAKSKAGVGGVNAKLLFAISSRQTISYDGTGAISPASQDIVLTAQKQNTTAAVTWTVQRFDGTQVDLYPHVTGMADDGAGLGLIGDTGTMPAADFETLRGTTNGIILTATLTDSGQTLVDRVSIAKIQGGAAGASGISVGEVTVYQRAATAPATPSGGSYDFGTKVLTPPSGWSSTPPSTAGILFAARGTVFVTGTTGVSIPTWAGVGKVAQDGSDGAGVDVVFVRAATQPSTPAPSVGTPTGWYTDLASVPASSNPVWSSFGQRASAATNYTWDIPVRLEGIAGADALTIGLTNDNITLPADGQGNVSSYANATGSFFAKLLGADISTSFTLSTQTGGNPANLTVSYVGQTYTITGGFAANVDFTTLTILAQGTGVYSGMQIPKTVTLLKSKTGKDIVLSADQYSVPIDVAVGGAMTAASSAVTTNFTVTKDNTTVPVAISLVDSTGMPLRADLLMTFTNQSGSPYANNVPFSEDGSQWVIGGCTRVGGQVAPDGSSTAWKFTGTGSGSMFVSIAAVTAGTGGNNMFTQFFIKPGTQKLFQIGDASNGASMELNFNGTTPVLNYGIGTITALANGWYYVAAAPATYAGNKGFTIYAGSYPGNVSGGDFQIWGIQVLAGYAVSKPYILTTGGPTYGVIADGAALTAANFNTGKGVTGGVTVRATTIDTGQILRDIVSIAAAKTGVAGAQGAAGPALVLTPTAQAFTFQDGALAPSTQTITVTATLQNVTGTINWTTSPNIKSGTGSTFSINQSEFGALDQVVVTATVGTVTQSVTLMKQNKLSQTYLNVIEYNRVNALDAGGALLNAAVDTYLSPKEKRALIEPEITAIQNTYARYRAEGITRGVSVAALDSAYSNLGAAAGATFGYLAPYNASTNPNGSSIRQLNVATAIDLSTFRAYFGGYYDAEAALVTACNAKASTTANWSGTVNDNGLAPANNAGTSLNLVLMNSRLKQQGNAITQGTPSNWDVFYSTDTYSKAAVATWKVTAANTFFLAGLLPSIPAGAGDPYGYSPNGLTIHWDPNSNETSIHTAAGFVPTGVFGQAAGDTFKIVVDNQFVYFYKNGTLLVAPIAVPLDQTWRFGGQGYQGGISDIRFSPGDDMVRQQKIATTGRVADPTMYNTQFIIGAQSATNLAPTYTDNGTYWTVNLPAHDRAIAGPTGPIVLHYGAGSFAVAYNEFWIAAIDDPNLTGNSSPTITKYSSTDQLLYPGRYYISSGTAPASSGVTPPPPGTGGGSGGCVDLDSFMHDDRLVTEFESGDELRVLDETTMEGTRASQVVYKRVVEDQPCVKLTSASGIWIVCSLSTPLTLRDNTVVFGHDVLGSEMAVEDAAGFRWEEIVSVEDAGRRPVMLIFAENQSYAAGGERGRFIYTHNIVYNPKQ
jgi:predicted phage tail protein